MYFSTTNNTAWQYSDCSSAPWGSLGSYAVVFGWGVVTIMAFSKLQSQSLQSFQLVQSSHTFLDKRHHSERHKRSEWVTGPDWSATEFTVVVDYQMPRIMVEIIACQSILSFENISFLFPCFNLSLSCAIIPLQSVYVTVFMMNMYQKVSVGLARSAWLPPHTILY